MAFWNLKSATVSIGGSPVVNHGFAEFDCTKTNYERETMHAGTYPDPAVAIDGYKCEGSLKYAADSATAFPSMGVEASTALVVTGTGVYFSGNVILSDVKLTAGTDNKSADLSFNFKTIDQDFSFDNAA
jgi:hypothetical protein